MNQNNNQDNQNTQNDKLFTQEEVNKIVQTRLQKMKDKTDKAAGSEYENKIKELEAREHKLSVLEALHRRGMDPELGDIIQCTDEKDLENKLGILDRIYAQRFKEGQQEEKSPGFKIGVAKPERKPRGDAVRKAMGMNY